MFNDWAAPQLLVAEGLADRWGLVPVPCETAGNYPPGAVLESTGTDIVDAACRQIPITRDAVGPDGTVSAPGPRAETGAAIRALAERLRHRNPRRGAADRVCDVDNAFFAALLDVDADALHRLLTDDFLLVDVAAGDVHVHGTLVAAVRDGVIRFSGHHDPPGGRGPTVSQLRAGGDVEATATGSVRATNGAVVEACALYVQCGGATRSSPTQRATVTEPGPASRSRGRGPHRSGPTAHG